MLSELPISFSMIYHIIIKDELLIRVTVAVHIVIVMIKQVSYYLFPPHRKKLHRSRFHSEIYYLYTSNCLFSVWFLDISNT